MLIPTVVSVVAVECRWALGICLSTFDLVPCLVSTLGPRNPLEAHSFHPCLCMAVYLPLSVLPPRSPDTLNPSCKHRSGFLVLRPSVYPELSQAGFLGPNCSARRRNSTSPQVTPTYLNSHCAVGWTLSHNQLTQAPPPPFPPIPCPCPWMRLVYWWPPVW